MSDAPLPPLDPDLFGEGFPPIPPHDPPPTPTPGNLDPKGPRTMSTPFKINRGEFGLSLTDPAKAIDAATIADYTDFSCKVIGALVRMSPNFNTEEDPGTFCDPPGSSTSPAATTFELEVEALQDPQEAAGLAHFLWTNDSGVSGNPAYFYLGLSQGSAPKAIGRVWLAPMDFGGEARTTLRASLRLAIDGRPDLEFGTTADA